MKKDEFKQFVKNNPILINYVKNNQMTWQKFYEMYDLYGEDSNIWNDYIKKESINNESKLVNDGITGLTLSEIVKWFKNVDLDSLQEGIGSVQRVLGVVQDLTKKESKETNTSSYKPRPLYKHFED